MGWVASNQDIDSQEYQLRTAACGLAAHQLWCFSGSPRSLAVFGVVCDSKSAAVGTLADDLQYPRTEELVMDWFILSTLNSLAG